MQFNGKTIFLHKQMRWNVNQFSEIQAYLARVYCEDTGYGQNNFVLFKLRFINVFLCLSTHI